MRRVLLQSPAFVRAAKRLMKKHPEAMIAFQETLVTIGEDAFHPTLKTHKLKGDLDGSWAAYVGYDLRIIFAFVTHEGSEAVLLQTVGTHDEVY